MRTSTWDEAEKGWTLLQSSCQLSDGNDCQPETFASDKLETKSPFFVALIVFHAYDTCLSS